MTTSAVLPQDLFAQFTVDDASAIQSYLSAGRPDIWLMWQSLVVQRDPMDVTNARFLAGWSHLRQALGASRMAQIATALGIEVGTG